ncbi:MAG: SDR family oxidoreductase, partial [Candidatus Heimdallarchaeota archaeon]
YKISGVVNFAGITRDRTIFNMSETEWDQVINVNLKGTYNIVQAFGRVMKELGGTIITVGSVVSRIGNYGQVNYVAAKAGVEGLTRTAAREFARFRIRVNCIVPGFIESPMSMAVPKDRIEIIRNSIPLGRIGKPEEIAHLAEFLLSDKSSYITGASIQIDGGLRM